MAKKIAKKEETGIVLSEDRPDFMGNSQRGSEDVTIDDLTIPRVDIIQDLSPQHKKNKPEYIEGAEVGMLFNTVTGKLYGNKVLFVPVYFRKEWIIWKHQNAGGGFMGAFPSELDAQQSFADQGFEGETTKVNGVDVPTYEIVDTAQHFGLIVNENSSIEEVVVSMSKSKMKVSRKINSMVKLAGGDRFSRAYEISAVEDQNAAGQDYWNMGIKQLGFVDETIYNIAEIMYESVSSGGKTINHEPTKEKEVNADNAEIVG